MIVESLISISINGKIVTGQIDKADFTKFCPDQVLFSPNQFQIFFSMKQDEKNLLESLELHHPNFLAKQENLKSSIEKMNYLRLELLKIYKKYSEPYNLNYHSVNQPSIDLEKIYKIPIYSITLNSNFSENSSLVNSILELRSGYLGKSGPGPKAKADARNAMNNRSPKGAKSKSGGSDFVEAWVQNPSNRARPGGNGLFGRFSARPAPDPYNPGWADGPRSVTVRSGQRNSDLSTNLTAYDGFESELTDRSLNHLTSKHGHKFGVDDPLPRNPNQKPTKYEQTLTRLNNENKAKVREEISSILSNTNSEVFTDVSIRGIQGRVYHFEERVVGIHTEGEFAGQIVKTQPISKQQKTLLDTQNKLD